MIFDENEVKLDELSEESLAEVVGGVEFPVPRLIDPDRGSPLDDEKTINWRPDDDDGGGWTDEPSAPTKPGTYELYGISY